MAEPSAPGAGERPSTRAELVDAAAAEMRADAQAVAHVPLSYLEPLVLPGMADRWIENGGTVD